MFEPNSPQEPQWFPRPITDYIESSLDLLERLEEDRQRRLRNIATVAARTPIGLGGVEDRGHAGSTSTHSPKPASCPGSSNEYARYRHYPPLYLTADALIHASYHRNDRSVMNSSTTLGAMSVVTRTNRQFRRGTTPRSTGGTSTTEAMRVDGGSARTLESDGSIRDRGNMNVDDTHETSSHHHQRQSTSLVVFASPPIDPRAGGGYSAAGRRRSVHAPHQYQLQSSGERSRISRSYATRYEEWITPPGITVESQPPGNRAGENIYSQRRDVSQRRRRRRWEEVNVI